jgi:beta-lactamase superfamily II metal-dependent hydrolase
MELTVFRADKGDCLLLTGADGRRMLIDGGMPNSYHAHVAPALSQLQQQDEPLDLVCVSHIDEDHIAGVLQMFEDEVAWRVYQYHQDIGDDDYEPPSVPQPPTVSGIWHNGFGAQVGENTGPIESMLTYLGRVLSGADIERLRTEGMSFRNLATGVAQGVELSRRIGPDQLGIPLNSGFDDGYVKVQDGTPDPTLGGMSLTIIGPTEDLLEKVRKKWDKWVRGNDDRIREIDDEMRRDEERLISGASEPSARLHSGALASPEVARLLLSALTQADELGRRSEVTKPNLASIMLLVEEGDKSILLTGDGHAEDILGCLDAREKLTDGRLHVNVFKVPHHGSEHNLDPDFCKKVTADHYIFSANGAHENPHEDIVQAIVDGRLNSGVQGTFKLWFNHNSTTPSTTIRRNHMEDIETKVAELAQSSNDRMEYFFLGAEDSFPLPL